MASMRLAGLSYATTTGPKLTKEFFAGSPLCPWCPSWFSLLARAEQLLTPIEEERGEAMLEKKDPSGAPQNSSSPPMIVHAAPGGPSTQAEQPAQPPELSEPANAAAGAPLIRRWRLRFLVEIIKKR